MARVAFIGLGVMGYPMAGHLKNRGGHDVTVYNRTSSKAEQWVAEFQGSLAATPAEAASDQDFVLACVGNDDDLRAITTGPDGAFSALSEGAIFVDHTTASASVARVLGAEAAANGFGFIDAPVSGGQAGAENGSLTVMCGGDQATFEKAEPVIGAYARKVGLLGPTGSGQLTKMVNQICIAGVLQGLAEGIQFAHRAGLDIGEVVEVIAEGAAGSWQMENRHHSMDDGQYDFGFAVDWMRKDLGMCLNEADRNGASLPLTALVDQFYKDVQAKGGGRWDTSALLTRFEP